jgi:hypothetical protein
MSKFMTYDYWETNFKPIKNKISKYADDDLIHFETYGEEVEFVKQAYEKNPNTIWTEVDGDSGTYIVAGYHYVNRIHYYITENAWDDEYTEIPTWCYREAEEDEDADDDEDPDFRTVNIPIDTVEDLKAIYGEDAPIVG